MFSAISALLYVQKNEKGDGFLEYRLTKKVVLPDVPLALWLTWRRLFPLCVTDSPSTNYINNLYIFPKVLPGRGHWEFENVWSGGCCGFCCYLLPWKVLMLFVWQLHNIGPSSINNTVLHVDWPVSSREEFLLYILHIQTHGPLHCQTSSPVNTMQIKVSQPLLFPSLSAICLIFFCLYFTMEWSFWIIFHGDPKIIFLGKKRDTDSTLNIF